jgi:hypothetical protein
MHEYLERGTQPEKKGVQDLCLPTNIKIDLGTVTCMDTAHALALANISKIPPSQQTCVLSEFHTLFNVLR